MMTAGSRPARRAALLLALFAVALRLATPGWATTVSGDAATGLRTITICTGVGYETITIDAEGRRVEGPTRTDTSRDLHHDCLSCCMRTGLAVLPAPAVAPLPAILAVLRLPVDQDQPSLSAAEQTPHARAPPSA